MTKDNTSTENRNRSTSDDSLGRKSDNINCRGNDIEGDEEYVAGKSRESGVGVCVDIEGNVNNRDVGVERASGNRSGEFPGDTGRGQASGERSDESRGSVSTREAYTAETKPTRHLLSSRVGRNLDTPAKTVSRRTSMELSLMKVSANRADLVHKPDANRQTACLTVRKDFGWLIRWRCLLVGIARFNELKINGNLHLL